MVNKLKQNALKLDHMVFCKSSTLYYLKLDSYVLQSKCWSPILLFYMLLNTLIKTTDEARTHCLEYTVSATLSRRHWFQFADNSMLFIIVEKDSSSCINSMLYIAKFDYSS